MGGNDSEAFCISDDMGKALSSTQLFGMVCSDSWSGMKARVGLLVVDGLAEEIPKVLRGVIAISEIRIDEDVDSAQQTNCPESCIGCNAIP